MRNRNFKFNMISEKYEGSDKTTNKILNCATELKIFHGRYLKIYMPNVQSDVMQFRALVKGSIQRIMFFVHSPPKYIWAPDKVEH